MKSEYIDWKLLKGSLIVFVITITVSSTLLFGAFYFRDQMQVEFNRTNAVFRSISNRYLAVDEEEKLIRTYLPRFIEFYENGVIGKEQRLNWIEVLRDTGEEMRLPSLNYQIESQQEFTPEFPLNLGKYKLYSSTMSLTMQLLHEGDLFRIIDKLERDANGRFTLSFCSITPQSEEIVESPDAANISARCELRWYTIRLADGKQIEV